MKGRQRTEKTTWQHFRVVKSVTVPIQDRQFLFAWTSRLIYFIDWNWMKLPLKSEKTYKPLMFCFRQNCFFERPESPKNKNVDSKQVCFLCAACTRRTTRKWAFRIVSSCKKNARDLYSMPCYILLAPLFCRTTSSSRLHGPEVKFNSMAVENSTASEQLTLHGRFHWKNRFAGQDLYFDGANDISNLWFSQTSTRQSLSFS